MRPGRPPAQWLHLTASDASAPWPAEEHPTAAQVDAWLASLPTDGEMDSWLAGEGWALSMEARGIEVPPVPDWLAKAYGVSETAKLVYGAARELTEQVLFGSAAMKIARRLGRLCGDRPLPGDLERITAALMELERAGVAHRVRGGLVLRRRSA